MFCNEHIPSKRWQSGKLAPYYRLLGQNPMKAQIIKGILECPVRHLVFIQKGNDGTFNDTYNAYDIREGIPLRGRYVKKVINGDWFKKWENEVRVHLNLQKKDVPNLVKLHDIIGIDYRYNSEIIKERAVLLEECSGDLLNLSNDPSVVLDDYQRKSIVRQLFEAFLKMHELGVIHGDVKPENILYKIIDQQVAVKVADFGAAKLADKVRDFVEGGTPAFLPFEAFHSYSNQQASQELAFSIDMWGLGVVAYTLKYNLSHLSFDEIGKEAVAIMTALWAAENELGRSMPPATYPISGGRFVSLCHAHADYLVNHKELSPEDVNNILESVFKANEEQAKNQNSNKALDVHAILLNKILKPMMEDMIDALLGFLDNSNYDYLIKSLFIFDYKKRWTAATALQFIEKHPHEPNRRKRKREEDALLATSSPDNT